MLYIFDELSRFATEIYPDSRRLDCVYALLPEQRRDKAGRIKTMTGKIESITAYLLLRAALNREHGIDEAPEFEYGEHGKPSLVKHPDIHFSLSHCKCAAACAISNNPVGVDIQHIAPVKNSVAERVLTEAEYETFKISDNPDEYFCRLWTIKEAYLKMSGQGIGGIISGIPARECGDMTVFRNKGCICAVSEEMKVINVSLEELLSL